MNDGGLGTLWSTDLSSRFEMPCIVGSTVVTVFLSTCLSDTITALFKTNFRIDFPFDTEEFIAFSLIG